MNASALEKEDPHDLANQFMARTNQESIKKIAQVLKEHDLSHRALEEKVNGLMRSISTLQQQNLQLQQRMALLQAQMFSGGATAGG